MESVYVMTGKVVYKDMTRFWGKLFGINFALGVTTGITLEFQFGTNWAYYSHYVGDIFGAPLAIEGLMAFFLESTFIGLFFFGWDRLSKQQHLMVTILMAVGTNLSALWILIANGWMQNPGRRRIQLRDHAHGDRPTSGRCCSTPMPRRSSCTRYRRATSPARCSCCRSPPGTCCKGATWSSPSAASASPRPSASPLLRSVIVLGDESGYTVGEAQQTKLAAMEAMWETEPAPAPASTLIAIPNEEKMHNDFELQIPWVMGLIGTRSLDQADPGHPRDQGQEPRRASSPASRPSRRSTPCARTRSTPAPKQRSRRTRRTSASACC